MDLSDAMRINRALIRSGKLFRALQAARLAEVGLHPGQDRLLHHLAQQPEDGASVGAIAAALGVESPTVSRSVDRLAGQGWLDRIQDPEDRRSTRVVLTERGRSVVRDIERIWTELASVSTTGLDPSKVVHLVDLLEAVQEHLAATLGDESGVPG